VGSPRLSIWAWAALGLGGLAIAGVGALLYLSAWDTYVSANPRYIYDAVHPSRPRPVPPACRCEHDPARIRSRWAVMWWQ